MKKLLLLITIILLFISCEKKSNQDIKETYSNEQKVDTIGLADLWNGNWSVNVENYPNAICSININDESLTIPGLGKFNGDFNKERFYGEQSYVNVTRELYLFIKSDSIGGYIKATQEGDVVRSTINGKKIK